MSRDRTGSQHASQAGTDPAADDLSAVTTARWFAGKSRALERIERSDQIDVPDSAGGMLVLVDATYRDGGRERYLLPVVDEAGRLREARADEALWPALVRALSSGAPLDATAGRVSVVGTNVPPVSRGARRLTEDQSNTSVVLGEELVVKCYRRLERGTHPEAELLHALDAVECRAAPRFAGSLVYQGREGDEALAVVYRFVPGDPVGWEPIIGRLTESLRTAQTDAVVETAGDLAERAAELHLAIVESLGSRPGSLDDGATAEAAALAQLEDALASLPDNDPVHDAAPAARARLAGLRRLEGTPLTRVHGDLHVAQFVSSPDGHVAIDFEGEPGRSLEERRRPTSPLRDLACLLLSLDHVAVAAARRVGATDAVDAAWSWSEAARAHAIERYAAAIDGGALVLDRDLLAAFEVEKECRELLYAATVLPEWLYAPRATFSRLFARA